MLKLGQAKASSWTNPIGKRNANKATKWLEERNNKKMQHNTTFAQAVCI
jgi:phage-related protein